jgi:hypothetical protein
MSDGIVCAAADRLTSFRVGRVFMRRLCAAALLLVATLGLQACGGGGGGDDPPPPPPPPAAPTALSYTSPQSYTVGTAITPLTATVTGTVASYGVSPALPAGLALDTASGTISGTPTAAAAQAAYTVTATNAGGATTFALTLGTSLERALADRADEKTGHQVHVMYVLPLDSADDSLDKLGKIEGSVRAWNKWFSVQTGGKEVRLDTYGGGRLDVTFLRLTKTDAEMSVANANVRDKIEYHLLANSFDSVDKVYLVYYGGTGDACGKSAWPPTLHGKVSAVYKTSGNATNSCTALAYAGENDAPRYPEFIAVHETLHALGFAASCAPHHATNGHVSDSPTDLMYAGVQPWAPATLDVNHDDYFGAANVGCIDLQASDFLDPLPGGAQSPPGWPYSTLTDLGCSAEATTVPGTGVDTQAMFVNAYAPGGTPTNVAISELVPNGAGYQRQLRTTVAHLAGAVLTVKENAVFVATANTVNGACLAVVRTTAQPNRFAVR